jgi:anhydro-N-acetylmuramic acid kinase
MNKSTYYIIGVMSGTSVDGIDICYSKYILDESWLFEIIKCETIPYSKKWKNILNNVVNFDQDYLKTIDINYTSLLAKVINNFISLNSISQIDAISSHGHTVFHKPNDGITFQIGNLKLLSTLTKHTCVCDFRVQDVLLAGQGAPLVPVGDKHLFSKYKYCINLGGFTNISFSNSNEVFAFDICPLNIVLNRYAQKLGYEYDDYGKFSSKGKIILKLLNFLNSNSFYKKNGPKSLGLEWVNENIFDHIDKLNYDPYDILCTFVEHSAIQIANTLNRYGNNSVLLTGGGTYNKFFLKRLIAISSSNFVIPDKNLIEFKEALIFGFLGILRLRNENNCFKSVTGASKDHCSGKIYEIFN